MRIRRWLLLGIVLAGIIFVKQRVCAAEKMQNTEYNLTENLLSGYDFQELNQNAGEVTDFGKLVKEIIMGGSTLQDNFAGAVFQTFAEQMKLNRKAFVQVILLSIISAVFANFADAFSSKQVSQTGVMMTNVAMVTILIAVYTFTARTATEALEQISIFLKLLMPAYAAAVAFCSGSVTMSGFYELLMGLVLVINIVFTKVIIGGGSIYIMLTTAECVAKEKSLSRMAELVKTILGWVIKTTLVAVVGINAIQGMILPITDSVKNGVLTRAMGLIPGIGSGANALSSTILGAGALIKNGIGAAALVVIVGMCITPIIKIAIFVVTYYFAGALLQPVADARTVECIQHFAEGMKLMLLAVASSMILVFIVIALVSNSTNAAYYSM